MGDMSAIIVPKSDQINADDLLGRTITITVTDVTIRGGQEQPISIHFEGSDKVFRPCKSMCRVMAQAWGLDSKLYVGRSMTLYCDPTVKFGPLAVGGIRISHMSHIDGPMVMALTATKGVKKSYKVVPLTNAPAATAPVNDPADDKNADDLIGRIEAAAKADKLEVFLARPQVVEWRAFFKANRPDLSVKVEAAIAPVAAEDDSFGGPDDAQRGETHTATPSEDAEVARLLDLLETKVKHEDVLSLVKDWQPKLDAWSPENRERVAIAQDARVEAIRGQG